MLLPFFVQALSLSWLEQPQASFALELSSEAIQTQRELLRENALFREQLVILRRQVKKHRRTRRDRLPLLLVASRLPSWRQARLILQPETLLRSHRQGFRLFWQLKSRARPGRPRLSPELVALIQQIAAENRLWGAESIRG